MKIDIPYKYSQEVSSIKKNQRLHILHLSDLNIDGEDEEKELTFEKLTIQFENILFKNRIDYLVIKGNLTREANKKSFDKAFEIINKLACELLKLKDEKYLFLSRVMLIPGENDIPGIKEGKPNYKPLQTFWKKFFKTRMKDGVKFIAHEEEKYNNIYTSCRDLLDVTLIGVPDWLLTKQDFSLEKLLKQRKKRDKITYLKSTPTILVAHKLSEHLNEREKKINGIYLEKINVILQLMGATDYQFVPKVNDPIKHISIGTEKLSEDQPLKATLIYLRPYSSTKTKLRVDNWNYQKKQGVWKRELLANRDFDGRISKKYGQFKFSPAEFPQVRKILHEPNIGVVIIKGFPGSGKSEFYSLLLEKYEDCLPIQLDFDENIEILKNRIRSLQKENKKSNKTILLIRDHYFHKRGLDEKKELLKQLGNVKVELGKNARGLLYIYSSFGSENDDELFRSLHHKYNVIKINNLDEKGFVGLFAQYSQYIPLDQPLVQKLTGKYAGFTRLILNEILKRYASKITSHNIIDEAFCRKLIIEAFDTSSGDLIDEIEIFKIALSRIAGGPKLIRLIENRIKEKINSITNTGTPLKKYSEIIGNHLNITINIDEVEESQREEIQRVINYLGEDNILRKDRNNKKIYHLNIIAPFLISDQISEEEGLPDF